MICNFNLRNMRRYVDFKILKIHIFCTLMYILLHDISCKNYDICMIRLNVKIHEENRMSEFKESNVKGERLYVGKLLNTSGFATTHVVVSVRHPITY